MPSFYKKFNITLPLQEAKMGFSWRCWAENAYLSLCPWARHSPISQTEWSSLVGCFVSTSTHKTLSQSYSLWWPILVVCLTPGRGNLKWIIVFIRLSCGHVCGHFSTANWSRRACPTVGGAISSDIELNCQRKKSINRGLPKSLLQFLLQVPALSPQWWAVTTDSWCPSQQPGYKSAAFQGAQPEGQFFSRFSIGNAMLFLSFLKVELGHTLK